MIPHRCGACGGAVREYVERSCPACRRVSLHDVDDAHAFVHATIRKSGLSLTDEQRDELAAEGLRALTKLAREYQPGLGGRDAAGSRFSGYAAKFLPGKLSDAWHRLRDHSLVTQPDQSRRWQINPAPASLDAIGAADDGAGLDAIGSLQVQPEWDPEVVSELPKLLADWWDEQCALVIRYTQLRSDGYRNGDVLDEMRLSPAQLKQVEGLAQEMVKRLRRLSAVVAAA